LLGNVPHLLRACTISAAGASASICAARPSAARNALHEFCASAARTSRMCSTSIIRSATICARTVKVSLLTQI
jgi:hypothetical protein